MTKFPDTKNRLNGKTRVKSKKLIADLNSKKRYIVHYKLLKYALKSGLILKDVHSAVEFQQKAWLKPYIDNNMNMRNKSVDEFEKNFYKLKNNAIYGKMLEDK